MNGRSYEKRFVLSVLALSFLMLAFSGSAAAQSSRRAEDILGGLGQLGKLGRKAVDIKVGEITLESIDFRDQTARLNVALDVSNPFVPVSIKDFDYSLRLYGQEAIEGRYDGTMRLGGKRSSRVNLPLVMNLRSVPSVLWSAFRNRGRVEYELDTAFTLPLFIAEKRFDQSFSGEVQLRSMVDAESLIRAQRLGGGGGGIVERLGIWQ